VTIFDGNGFINKARVTLNMNVKGNEFDTATIGQVAKHEICHGIGLVTQTLMVSSSMAERVNDEDGKYFQM
jgi:predicted SprT family Zn-dependent metalloprotease